jgi:hypothetical protein
LRPPSSRVTRAVAALLLISAMAVVPPLWRALFAIVQDPEVASLAAPPWGLSVALLAIAGLLAARPLARWSRPVAALALGCLLLLWFEVGYRVFVRLTFPDPAKEELAFIVTHAMVPREDQLVGHPFLHYVGNPDAVRYNSLGFPDREHAVAKPAGTLRVACLGGSTTASGYPATLEDWLRSNAPDGQRWEVLNFGLEGWTSLHSLVNLSVRGLDYRPDWVVIHHAHNDVAMLTGSTPTQDYGHALSPYAWLGPRPVEQWLLGHSLLYQQLWSLQRSSTPTPSPTPLARRIRLHREPTDVQELVDVQIQKTEPRPEDLAVFERHLRELMALAHSHDARVLFATMPSSSTRRTSTDTPLGQANDTLRRLASEGAEDALLVDIERELGRSLEQHFIDVIHLDNEGRRRKAEHIGQALLDGQAAAAEAAARPAPQEPEG